MKKVRDMALKPDFDREGRDTWGIVSYILALGAGSKTGGLARYAAVLMGESLLFFRCFWVLLRVEYGANGVAAAFGVQQYLARK